MTIKAIIICGKSRRAINQDSINSNKIKICLAGIIGLLTKVESNCNANGDNTDAYYPVLDWSDALDWQLIKVVP